MPQYNSYSLVTSFLGPDVSLFFKDSVGALRTITGTNFAASIKALIDPSFSVTPLSGDAGLTTEQFVIANSGATFVITLPLSASYPGKQYYIANKGAGAVTIAATAPNTIGGAASVSLAQYKNGLFISDGLGMWHWFGNPT